MIKTNASAVEHRLAQLAKTVDENLDYIVQETIADIGDSLTADPDGHGGTGTPRDTQRATNNWNVSNGTSGDFSDLGPGRYGEPDARAQAYTKIPRGSIAANIANGTHYISQLDRGWSQQAPMGFIRRAINRAIRGIDNINLFRSGGVRGS